MTISNKRLFQLAAQLLELASDRFSCHSCNDFKLPDWTPAERRQLALDFEEWNGDKEWLEQLQALPEGDSEFDCFSDSSLMSYLVDKLNLIAKEETERRLAEMSTSNRRIYYDPK